MNIFAKWFPPPAVKTMLAALEVVSDDLRRSCAFSPFGGVQAFEELIRGMEKYLWAKSDSLTGLLADGKVTPLLGIWKAIYGKSRDNALSADRYEEQDAYKLIVWRSLDELHRLNFFTEEQTFRMRINFLKELKG